MRRTTRFGTVAAIVIALMGLSVTMAYADEIDAADAPAGSAVTAAAAETAAPAVIGDFPAGWSRLAGSDRYATSVEITKKYAPRVPVLYIATGENYPDALAAAAAAARAGGPLLLTMTNSMPSIVRAEIRRLAPTERIIVVGGEPSVSAPVFAAIEQIAAGLTVAPGETTPTVERIGGIDRYQTAERLIADAFPWADVAYVATGNGFADALAASPAAAALGAPVFLIEGQAAAIRGSTIQLMKDLGIRTIRIAGSTPSVSAPLGNQLWDNGFTVYRDDGPDRFGTAVAINDVVFGGRSTANAFIATGAGFADALAGATLAGSLKAPLYLVNQSCMPYRTSTSIAGADPDSRIVFGGQPSVGDAVIGGTLCPYWVKPAAGRITDVYGPREPICTPGGCTSAFHRGTDIGTGCNNPVYAVSEGTITYAGVNGTFGNFVRVKHDERYQTGYAHLSQIQVSSGQYVYAGQQIGLSGTTGASTGCHLHFEVYQDGTYVGSQIDPVPFMRERGAPLG